MLFDDIVITSILGVMVIPTTKDRALNIINRPSYALSFCMDDGVIVYNKNGKEVYSRKNTAVILPKGATYSLHNEEGGSFPIINFLTNKAFTEDFIEIKLKNPDIYLKEFEQMRIAKLKGTDTARLYSLFYAMLSRLGTETEHPHPVLANAINFIYDNISDPDLTNMHLAEREKISEIYFRKLFKEHYGITPKQYIISVRIEEAKRLLEEGISSITAISDACGFSSVYHFSRAFKQVTGVSPSDYSRNS